MAQAVSCWPLTMEDQVQSQTSSCEICGAKKWHCDRFFHKHFAGFPLSVSFHQYSISFTHTCIARSKWRSSQFMYITIYPTCVNLESSSTWYYHFVKSSSNESISTCRGLQPPAASSTSSKCFSRHPVLKCPLHVLSLE